MIRGQGVEAGGGVEDHVDESPLGAVEGERGVSGMMCMAATRAVGVAPLFTMVTSSMFRSARTS